MQKFVPLVKQNLMKLEVFILGGQKIEEEKEGMVEREKRENIERKDTKETELTI